MWQPEPAWQPLRGAGGPASAGLWLAVAGGDRWVVKRLTAPEPRSRAHTDPTYVGYWRREVEIALDPGPVDGPGLVPPEFGPVEEDDEGVTIWTREEEGTPPSGLFVARALGRFAGAVHTTPHWATRRLLADRLEMAEDRGGWPTLARTTLADVAERLWQRRGHWLARCGDLPVGRLHGDAVPANFSSTRGEAVVALDWQCAGVGPIGSDLGYYALSSREEFDVLADSFIDGAGPGADREGILLAARVTAVYTVLARAEWALAQAARGEGALAGKYRHPAVAPHLRALQRQFPQIEHLVG